MDIVALADMDFLKQLGKRTGMVVLTVVLLFAAALLFQSFQPTWAQAVGGLPSVDIKLGQATSPQEVSKSLQVLILLTILTLAPSIFIMTTAFTRIVIVLSLVRQAVGSPQLPPNQIIVGLALILTFFVMSPTFTKMNNDGLQPYLAGKMSQQEALKRATEPMRVFMFRQTDQKDIELFQSLAKLPRPQNSLEVPTHVLIPAFIISEIKTGFTLGFVVFLPFLIIDVVVSSILVSMGMLFLPPATIALPFKIILFVLVDGWRLICKALVMGFH